MLLHVAGHEARQIAADDVLLGHEVFARHHAEVEHGDDVGVDQTGLHARLVDELGDGLLLVGQLRPQPFEHEVAREPFDPRHLGDEELRHPAFAETIDQSVAPEDSIATPTGPVCRATARCAAAPCGLRMLTALPSVMWPRRDLGRGDQLRGERPSARGRAGVPNFEVGSCGTSA